MAINTDIISSQDKSITEPRSTSKGNFYKLPEGKNYLRVALDKEIVDALTEAYGTGEAVEAKHEEFQEDIFQPMVDDLDIDTVTKDRLDSQYGFLEEKVESIRKEYANREKSPRNISANKAFDIAVKWYTNK